MKHLLVCTDLDRTLLPNGFEPESPGARDAFATLTARPEVTLAYVSGRHQALVEEAISEYRLPVPDFVVADVGTTIYAVGPQHLWQRQMEWEDEVAKDWNGRSHTELAQLLGVLPELKLQEPEKQGRIKLSYYTPLKVDPQMLITEMQGMLWATGVRASLVWSVDEAASIGLLDVLPERATKFHAVEALIRHLGMDQQQTVFCGDSGNDLEVLVSSIPAVLVGNSRPQVRQMAEQLAASKGYSDRLYIARGNFMGMNGNYAAGMLEGIAHYYPESLPWMGFQAADGVSV